MQDRILKVLPVIALLLVSGESAAGTDVRDVANDTIWLKLVKYEEPRFSQGRYESVVLSDEFFLAEDGKENPLSELEATIVAMSEPLDGDPNAHAQCRFPGRYLWMRRQGLLADVGEIECPNFNAWIHGEATDSISIIFATGYLGNPASYYGHTLLKFNSSTARDSSKLLDVTVNYGAIIPPNVSPVSPSISRKRGKAASIASRAGAA